MSFISKFFGSNKKDNTDEVKKPLVVEMKTKDISIEFAGLDLAFIDLLYFPTNSEKEKYISTAKDLIAEFSFNKVNKPEQLTQKWEEVYTKYSHPIPFLPNLYLYQSIKTNQIISNGITEEIINKEPPIQIGDKKLNNIYTRRDVIIHNLQEKIKNKASVFFEDEQKSKDFFNSMEFQPGLAELYIPNLLVKAFAAAGDFQKVEEYINFIINNSDSLSTNQISNFYKEFGELYLIHNDKEKALYYFEKGLDVNPKLSVKTLIKNLK